MILNDITVLSLEQATTLPFLTYRLACDEAAYDPILQAHAGFMDFTGESDGPPMVFGLPMVDLGAEEHGYGQIIRVLYRRADLRERKII